MALGMRAEIVCLLGPPVPQAREGPQVVPQNTKEEWCGHFRSGLMAGTRETAQSPGTQAMMWLAGGEWSQGRGGPGIEVLKGFSPKWSLDFLSSRAWVFLSLCSLAPESASLLVMAMRVGTGSCSREASVLSPAFPCAFPLRGWLPCWGQRCGLTCQRPRQLLWMTLGHY